MSDTACVKHSRFGASKSTNVVDSEFMLYEPSSDSDAKLSATATPEAFDNGNPLEIRTDKAVRRPGAPPVIRSSVDTLSNLIPVAAPTYAPAPAGTPLAAIPQSVDLRKLGPKPPVLADADAFLAAASVATSTGDKPDVQAAFDKGFETPPVDIRVVGPRRRSGSTSLDFDLTLAPASAPAPAAAAGVPAPAVATSQLRVTNDVTTAIAKLPATSNHLSKEKHALIKGTRQAAQAVDAAAAQLHASSVNVAKITDLVHTAHTAVASASDAKAVKLASANAERASKELKHAEKRYADSMIKLTKSNAAMDAKFNECAVLINAVDAGTQAEHELVDEAKTALHALPSSMNLQMDSESKLCFGEYAGQRVQCQVVKGTCPVRFDSKRCKVVQG